jgi:glycosyltransferase involved in cell wall biosynthesis
MLQSGSRLSFLFTIAAKQRYRLFAVVACRSYRVDLRIFIVDDGSTDGTAAIEEIFRRSHRARRRQSSLRGRN